MSEESNNHQSVSSVSDFKKNLFQELTLPSGNVCRVRRPGLQRIMSEGKIPNSLQKMLSSAVSGAKGAADRVVKDLSSLTPEQLQDAARFTDSVVVMCVKDPEVLEAPEDEADRDPELLYVDEVDENDKSFILNWAFGGTSSIAKFRDQQEELVGAISTGQDMGEDTG